MESKTIDTLYALARAIVVMFKHKEDAALRLHRALFACRYRYLRKCTVTLRQFLVNSERSTLQKELVEIHIARLDLDRENRAVIDAAAYEIRHSDGFLSRVLAHSGLTPTPEETPDFLKDFLSQLLTQRTAAYKALASITEQAPEAQSHSYAEYFATHLTDKIQTHIEGGGAALTREEMEDILYSDCLSLLYPSEVSTLAQRLR